MNKITTPRRCVIALAVAAVVYVPLPSAAGQAAEALGRKAQEAASQIVRASGASGGICVVVGRTDVDLALALAERGRFLVHCLYTNRALCDKMRRVIRSRDMCGTVSASTLDGGQLPYTDNLINVVVVDAYPALSEEGLSPNEVVRVLRPLGTAYFGGFPASADSKAQMDELATKLRSSGAEEVSPVKSGGMWLRAKKAWPGDIDEWTHYLHGPDGNPVARDRVVGPPKHYQWTAGPMWLRSHETDSSISTLVTSRGRLFCIVDEAPISLAGNHPLPDKWCLVARDAFNGVALWKVPIQRWGWREWKDTWFNFRPGDFPLNLQKRLVAVGDKLYVTLGYRAPVSEIDAKTGTLLKTYAGTERAGEILYLDGMLILSVLTGDQVKVMAVDAATGKQKWATPRAYGGSTVDYIRWANQYAKFKPPKLDPSLNLSTDGHAVAFIDRRDVVCLDFQTGTERWRSSFPTAKADQRAGGIKSLGNLWVGTMIVSDGVVIHASPNQLAAFSADTGKVLWTQPKKYIGHLWYEWKDVFVIDGLVWTWSAELDTGDFDIGRKRKQRTFWPRTVNGYDIKTGEPKKKVPLGSIFRAHHHHRCYRNKATLRYILASRRGTEYVDLEQGKHTVHNWVRGTCHVGMMPANGLQYVPPHPCACYIDEKLNGMIALAPARTDRSESPRMKDQERLEKGPAYGQAKASPSSPALCAPSDWPTFRQDSMRTGSVDTRVPDDAVPLWREKIGGSLSPPIVVADRLYASLIDEHHVVCLDARNGRRLWERAAGGRIDSPPTYHKGTVLFGSADGWVYCLRATDGQLVWRFRAAPEERLIGAFGQLESAWPVHGSVLVQDDTVYFAAGRSSQVDGGIHVYGIEATTGKLRHQTTLEGPHYTVDNVKENFKLPMGTLPDVLMADGSKIYMRSVAFDAKLKRQRGKPELRTKSGFLEDSYFKRVPWTYGKGADYGRLIVHDKRSVYYVRMFDTLRGLDPTVFFTPGKEGYLLFAKNATGGRRTWMERVRVRIRAMVLTPARLYVAGPPDVIDPADPLGAFEGRKGGLLYAVDSTSGEKLKEYSLPSPPVFNGAAAANGRLYIADEDGSIACFGKR